MFKRVGIIAKSKVQNLDRVIKPLCEYLRSHGIDVVLGCEAARVVNSKECVNRERLPLFVDLIIVLGGDGTFIAATRAISKSKRDIPILGVNLGNLGFLTEVPLSHMYDVLDNIFIRNTYEVERRMMIDVRVVRNGEVKCQETVFNDAVINKGTLARIIRIKAMARIGGRRERLVAIYHADGLIVATPSGSTAYNLAAGGPIVYPTLDSFICTPICPHTLSNRPLVLPDNVELSLQLEGESEDVMLTLDGQIGYTLDEKDLVVLGKSSRCIKLLTSKDKNYFDILREKLGWEERKIRNIKC